jgi:hypothetical protein
MRGCLVAAFAISTMMLPGCEGQLSDQSRLPQSASTANRPSAPSTTSAAPPSAAIADVHEVRSGDTALLVDVRLAGHGGFDRLVLEFADRVPGYTVGYRPPPAHADGSGAEIPLPGANALIQVTLTPATGWDYDRRTYLGPSTVTGGTASVTEVKAAGDFEAVLNWVVGLRAKVPFRVLVLDGPPRLVVDFQL